MKLLNLFVPFVTATAVIVPPVAVAVVEQEAQPVIEEAKVELDDCEATQVILYDNDVAEWDLKINRDIHKFKDIEIINGSMTKTIVLDKDEEHINVRDGRFTVGIKFYDPSSLGYHEELNFGIKFTYEENDKEHSVEINDLTIEYDSGQPEPVLESSLNYESDLPFDFYLACRGSAVNLSYSIDNGRTWTVCKNGIKIDVPANTKVMFRGDNPSGWSSDEMEWNTIYLMPDEEHDYDEYNVKVSGNIMALLDNGTQTATQIPCEYCFTHFFEYNGLITEVGNILTAAKLNNDCYSYMFAGCDRLIKAPNLEARVLAPRCYQGIFSTTSNLQVAPEIHCTNLAHHAFSYAFAGSGLKRAATFPENAKYAPYCYERMYEFSSIESIPDLPNAVLAEHCYEETFGYCYGLTDLSNFKLNAKKMAPYCFSNLFNCCQELLSAPIMPTCELEDGCLESMFISCYKLITPPKLAWTSLKYGCYNHMFWSCYALKEAPELPATELAEQCYYGMFGFCTSLEQSPILPATKLAESCYGSMFTSCPMLSTIYLKYDQELDEKYFNYWASGVAETGTIYYNGPTTEQSASAIPTGWTIEQW